MSMDACDPDPSSQMRILVSDGSARLWNVDAARATVWQQEIDDLMRRQMTTSDPGRRKQLYDRVQALFADNLPFIPLASPHVLAGSGGNLAGFQPSVMRPQGLWNVDRLYFRRSRVSQ
jgi:ABC-type transport system substrate-binding protein